MLKFIQSLFGYETRDPEVGMRLEDKVWGKEVTEVEIVAVSKDKKDVRYKYIRIDGKEIQVVKSTNSATWFWFCNDMYTIVEDTDEKI